MEPVLLYDGDCGFCSSVVHFVLEHERTDTLCFAALKSPAAGRMLNKDNELSGIDSVVWVDRDDSGAPEKILVRSAAALRLARYLGGGWRVLAVFWIVPRPARDFVYDLIARHRHRIICRQCAAATADNQHRFLG